MPAIGRLRMNRIKRIADLINLIMYTFCISVAGLFLIDAVTGDDAGISVLMCGNFVILLYVYFLRTRIRKMPVFVALHLPLFAACVLAGMAFRTPDPETSDMADIGHVFLWIVLCICLTVADIFFWMNAIGEEKSMPVSESGQKIENFRPIYKEGFPYLALPFVAVFVLGLAFGAYHYKAYYGKITYTLGVLFIGLYFLREYVKQMAVLKENMHRETGLHQKRILSSNAKLALPFIALAFVMMFLLQSDRLIRVFSQIAFFVIKWSGRILIIVVGYLFYVFGSATETTPMARASLYEPPREVPGWMQYLQQFMEHLLTVIFFGLLFYFLIRLIVFFIRTFRERSINVIRRDTYSDMTEVRERIARSERKGREKPERAPGTNAEKIRRLYRKFIRRQIQNGLTVEKNDTPLELTKRLADTSTLEEPVLVDITNLYDRARYSGRELHKEDVAAMERLL